MNVKPISKMMSPKHRKILLKRTKPTRDLVGLTHIGKVGLDVYVNMEGKFQIFHQDLPEAAVGFTLAEALNSFGAMVLDYWSMLSSGENVLAHDMERLKEYYANFVHEVFTEGALANLFDANRAVNWKETLDVNGIPTHGPEKVDYGCHYCGGGLDDKPGVEQYECPWCIARFGGVELTSVAFVEYREESAINTLPVKTIVENMDRRIT